VAPLAAAVVVAIAIAATGQSAAAAPLARCGGPHYYQNGEVYPVLCPSGGPNTQVLSVLKSLTPRIMSLPASAGYAQITSAVCADYRHGTIPILTDSYTYQFTRYHWREVNITPRTLALRIASMELCG
jgi:hypothetical protein